MTREVCLVSEIFIHRLADVRYISTSTGRFEKRRGVLNKICYAIALRLFTKMRRYIYICGMRLDYPRYTSSLNRFICLCNFCDSAS